MKQLSSGIVAGLVVLALVVALGAAQQSRTASKEFGIGTFNCNALVNGELNASISWEGTEGIVGVPEGLSIDLATVTEANGVGVCQTLADDIIALSGTRGCQVSRIRAIGLSRDFTMVCQGNRDEVVVTLGELSSRLAEVIP